MFSHAGCRQQCKRGRPDEGPKRYIIVLKDSSKTGRLFVSSKGYLGREVPNLRIVDVFNVTIPRLLRTLFLFSKPYIIFLRDRVCSVFTFLAKVLETKLPAFNSSFRF